VREGFLLPFCRLRRRRPGQPARRCYPASHLHADAGAAALASPPARAV